jgi:hypothetical protein
VVQTVTALAFVLILATGRAAAQQPAWNEDVIPWSAPTQCVGGAPLTNCAVTGYRVEEAAASSGPWTVLGTTNATTFSYTAGNRSEGQHCYRVVALSSVNSAASNVECATTSPEPAPEPPTLKTIDTIAYAVKPNESILAYVLDGQVGRVELGKPCDGNRTMRTNSLLYAAVNRKLYVTWTTNRRPSTVVVRCALS